MNWNIMLLVLIGQYIGLFLGVVLDIIENKKVFLILLIPFCPIFWIIWNSWKLIPMLFNYYNNLN